MHPVLIEVGGFTLFSYGALSASAFIMVCVICLVRAHRAGLKIERIADTIFATSVAGILGARGFFLWQTPDQWEGLTSLVDLRSGGLVFYGGVLAGLPAGFLTLVARKMPLLLCLDIFATALPLGHAVSRVGCFLSGCCYGSPTDLPWGVVYPPGGTAPIDVAVHPVQLVEAAGLVGLAALASWLYTRPTRGMSMAAYLMGYAVLRFAVEALRGDVSRGFVGPLSTSQAISLGVFAAGAVLAGFAYTAAANRADA